MGGTESQLAYYRLSVADSLKKLKSSKKGLATSEVNTRYKEYGPNRLKQVQKVTFFEKYVRQFKDLLIILLLVSAGIAAFLGDARSAGVLVVLVFFNTFIGFLQEFKAEKVMDSLEQLVVSETRVLRDDGVQKVIDATTLVPGDVVYIEAGDSVPADLRVIQESELQTNDFALTGESNPSRKFTHAIEGTATLGDRHNLVFMGTTVATGQAFGVVVATGMQTELGRIAGLSSKTKNDLSPLQKEMNHVATRVTQGTVVLSSILLFIAIKQNMEARDALLFAIGIASSLIPQGLAAEINTSLAQAANRLAKAKALVKKLSAVETLGATNVILTDKTGTLTKNQMTVQELLVGKDLYTVEGTGYEATGSINKGKKPLGKETLESLELFFATGLFASNADILPPDETHNSWYCTGDPTEGSLITLARKAGLDTAALTENHKELREFPFDSVRKRMSSIRKFGSSDQLYVFVKGSPESISPLCHEMWDHGHVRKMTVGDHSHVLKQHETWANNARRNLAFAYKILPKNTDVKKVKMHEIEKDLTFLGLVSMSDPLRDEVPAAMLSAHNAHIKVSIITGDFAPTAKAIATAAKLADTGQKLQVVSGEELQHLNDSQIMHLVHRGGSIFSRVSPEDKLRIVDLVKTSGSVVAVTGDGINDAPALKRADIGVAMGKTGTDVAKQSAEIVLFDDSFSTLVGAVQQGRIIFQNIKKGTLSCFTSNSAELVVNLTSIAAFSLFNVPLAITVMQILAIDLIAELFPIAALGWDRAERQIMNEQPRNLHDHILNRWAIRDLLWCGLLIGGFAFINYILFFWRNGVAAADVITDSTLHLKATSMTYASIVVCQLLNILQRRSSKGIFTTFQFHNKQLWLAIGFSLFCVANILYNPWLSGYFHSAPLSWVDWLYALGAGVLFITIREIQRHANTHHTRDHVLTLYAKKFAS